MSPMYVLRMLIVVGANLFRENGTHILQELLPKVSKLLHCRIYIL